MALTAHPNSPLCTPRATLVRMEAGLIGACALACSGRGFWHFTDSAVRPGRRSARLISNTGLPAGVSGLYDSGRIDPGRAVRLSGSTRWPLRSPAPTQPAVGGTLPDRQSGPSPTHRPLPPGGCLSPLGVPLPPVGASPPWGVPLPPGGCLAVIYRSWVWQN